MLKIAKDLELPIDAVTQKIAWLGRTGSGKTFACKRMVEQMLRAGAQVVILDPQGVWAGLRLGPKPFNVPVLGGLYGDIPLEPTAGALIADVVVKQSTSIVLDVSQMLDAELARFAAAFAKRFFQLKKSAPAAVHLVLEECQDFCPQNIQPGEQAMLHEFVRLAKQGRSLGIGISFLSQRPQEINKKALNQTECVFAFQMTGTHERKALEYWLSDKGFGDKLSDILPRLAVGAPHVWSPQWLKVSKIVHILPIDSLDTSRTPEVGEKSFEQKKLKPIDLKAISAAMAETVERAKSDDPKALRARVAELERELAKKQPPKPEPMPVAVATFDEAEFGQLFESISTLVDSVAGHAAEAKTNIGKLLVTFRSEQRKRVAQTKVAPTSAKKIPLTDRELREAVRPRTAIVTGQRDPEVGSGGLYRIMVALAQRNMGLTNRQIGVRAGISSKSGTFSTYMSKARANAWIDGKPLSHLTDAGISALGPFTALPTGEALQEYWLAELGGGASRLLRAFISAYPNGLSNAEAGARADISHSSGTFSTYMSRLRTLELIHAATGGNCASEELF